MKFTMQNISSIPIKKLNIMVVYKLNGKEIETLKKPLVEPPNQIAPGESLLESTILPTVSKKYKRSDIAKISVEIYLYKKKNNELCVYNDYPFAQKVDIKADDIIYWSKSGDSFIIINILR